MNGSQSHSISSCNSAQMSKNLPLKKRRAYLIDSSATPMDEDQNENLPKTSPNFQRSHGKEDALKYNLTSASTVPTPPASPHIEFLRQQQAFLSANTNYSGQSNYVPPSAYDCLMAQKLLAQQFFDQFKTIVQQQEKSSFFTVANPRTSTESTIDEHFRKSLGANYEKFSTGFLTPEDSLSNSSPRERTPTDSIEEHFTRSLAKYFPVNDDASSSAIRQQKLTESVVDEHFAKALGASTWERLKEKAESI